MSDKVSLVIGERSEQSESLSEASARASNTDGHSRTVSQVSIMTVRQMLNCFWHKLRLAEEQESDVCDGGTLDIIVDVRDGEFKQFLSSLRVHSSGICAANSIHGSLTHDCVLGARHLLNETISLLLSALHE